MNLITTCATSVAGILLSASERINNKLLLIVCVCVCVCMPFLQLRKIHGTFGVVARCIYCLLVCLFVCVGSGHVPAAAVPGGPVLH